MFIYIGGINSTRPTKRNRIKQDKTEEEHTKHVYAAITAIAKKGHLPVFSYTMLQGWNTNDGVLQELLRQVCN
jgi:hypothetical protein